MSIFIYDSSKFNYMMTDNRSVMRNECWQVNHKRVKRIWHQEGLKDPGKQPYRGRLWLNDDSYVRLTKTTDRRLVWIQVVLPQVVLSFSKGK